MSVAPTFLVVDGVSLAVHREHVASQGALRTPIIFLHDPLGCITTWREVPQRIGTATGREVIVYDRQGHGRSAPFDSSPRQRDYMHREADRLCVLLDQLEVPKAVLFGHSDGGTIALLAAAQRPAQFEAVITEGAHVFVEDITLAGIRAAEREYVRGGLRERLLRHHGERTEALVQAWTQTWQAPFFRSWDITADIAAVRCPVLVLQGVDDAYGTEAQVQAIARSVGGEARTYIIPGAAHTPHKEAPAITEELVTAFLAALP
ncbi:MAG TPA: alpha/beta hydrolase [Flavobacteriales bacterium]|jgi:pimeloyl-ACP methyl ester carboxylesterase|nr:alpha/beta hydrolase [Flavobacteriales bacterium]